MLKENNGWFCTDDNCLQYCKHLEDRKYDFIQVIRCDWVGELCAVNAKDESDNYIVITDMIDMNDYDREDIETAIYGYYGSIEEMEEDYGTKLENLDQIVAECFFENIALMTAEKSNIVSFNDAKKIIQHYIDTGNFILNGNL